MWLIVVYCFVDGFEQFCLPAPCLTIMTCPRPSLIHLHIFPILLAVDILDALNLCGSLLNIVLPKFPHIDKVEDAADRLQWEKIGWLVRWPNPIKWRGCCCCGYACSTEPTRPIAEHWFHPFSQIEKVVDVKQQKTGGWAFYCC